jgi:hypothetical protein
MADCTGKVACAANCIVEASCEELKGGSSAFQMCLLGC